MHRRNFLHQTLIAAVPFTLDRTLSMSAHAGPRIKHELLEARNQNRSTVVAQHGMVCASQPLAALAGIDVLKKGGNCIDAAIATNAVLGVTEPASNGLGGDLFAIVWIEKDQRLHGLNASGRAPYAWSLEAAHQRQLKSIPRISPLSWSVPGCVSGWGALQARFGKLTLADCLEAAIDYAGNGFPLSPLIASQFQLGPDADPSLRQLYNPGGQVPQYGDVFRNPELAQSYRAIAQGGPEAFYRGEIGEQIVRKSRALGGLLSARDLHDHEVNWVDPVNTSYRGWDVWELPPNGQGIAVLQILNLLEQFDLSELTPNSAEQLHLLIEAKKLVFEDRARYYADMAFAQVPVDWLLSKEYAKQRAAQIDPRRANTEPRPGDPPLDSDTVYLTAADNEGNMISLIQSLYHGFGSTICPAEVGFSIQNRGQAFSLAPDHANRLEPHKRPFHTIIPAFVTKDARPVLSFGVMGGDFQPQGHCQILMNLIDYGLSPQQAGEQPRIAHDGGSAPWNPASPSPGRVQLERGFSAETIQGLAELGHSIAPEISAHGGYQAIWREDSPRRYFGGSDPRKDGMAVGF